MSNEILIKALSLIARTDGGETELNAHACYLLAKSALEEYAAQQSAQDEVHAERTMSMSCPSCHRVIEIVLLASLRQQSKPLGASWRKGEK